MWIGHVAPAFLLRPFLPSVPLAVLFFGCASADVVAFTLSLLGIEQFRYNPAKHGALPYDFLMPYSHSLLGMSVWAVVLGCLSAALVTSGVLQTGDTRGKYKPTFLSVFVPTVLVTVSHWVFEIPVHRTLRDGVPFVPHGVTKFGWGWFEHQLLSNALELALFVPSFYFYLWRTRTLIAHRTLAWYARPMALLSFCVISQLAVCAAPQWFYKLTPDPVMLVNGITLMFAETAMAHAVDNKRAASTEEQAESKRH